MRLMEEQIRLGKEMHPWIPDFTRDPTKEDHYAHGGLNAMETLEGYLKHYKITCTTPI